METGRELQDPYPHSAPAAYPFDHSPPISPGQGNMPHTPLPASPTGDPKTSDSPTTSERVTATSDSHPRERPPPLTPPAGTGVHPHLPAPPPPMTEKTILTLNTQKMEKNSPSLTYIVTLLDQHTPDVLLLTETPSLHRQEALTHVLCNKGYKTHYHPVNALSPKDTLPEARLPTHSTHSGGGCWIAYNKHAPWASTVRNLTLPGTCPMATTCAI